MLDRGWIAQQWPAQLPRFVVAPAALRVRTVGNDHAEPFDVTRQPAGPANVVFLPIDDISYLERSVAALGGNARRQPRAVMETPNQPIGDAFTDAACTKAAVPVSIGYSGAGPYGRQRLLREDLNPVSDPLPHR